MPRRKRITAADLLKPLTLVGHVGAGIWTLHHPLEYLAGVAGDDERVAVLATVTSVGGRNIREELSELATLIERALRS